MRKNKSPHFQVEKLAEGVYAAIGTLGGAMGSNTGIIDLGGKTLIFDTGMSPEGAEALRDSAESLTQNPISYIVNSHFHDDHIWGNQIFAPHIPILATTETHRQIQATAPERFEIHKSEAVTNLSHLKRQVAEAQNEQLHTQLCDQVAYQKTLVSALTTLQICPPTLTFEKRMVVHGSTRSAEIVTLGGGHTSSDAVLYLPKEGIMFMGGLLCVDYHPFLSDGDPMEWLRIFDRLITTMPAKRFVPGQGRVGKLVDVKLMKAYLNKLAAIVFKLLDEGVSAEKIPQQPIPSAFAHWRLAHHYPLNLQFLYQRFAEL